MISLGTAVDMPADMPALPGAGIPMGPDDQYSDMFKAVLGEMLGDTGEDVDAEDERIEIDWDESSIDPNELVNQMVVDGGMPIVPLTTPTVWELSVESVTWKTDARAAQSSFSADDETLPAQAAGKAALTPPFALPAADADQQNDSAQLEQIENMVTAALAPSEANAAAAPSTTTSQRKHERTSTSAKAEKSNADQKAEATLTRPMPAVAIERAYASHERQSSKSFDPSGSQAPALTFQPSSQQMPMTAFVVPTDAMTPAASLASPTATSASPVVIDSTLETHLPAQIVQSIRMQAIDGGGEAIVRLRPEYLGEVVVAVKVEQGSVTAALQADTPAVRQWVERNEAVLRQGLAEHGLQLDRLTVSEKAGETENERHPDRQQQPREEPSRQQSRRRRPQQDETTFEVTV